MGTDLAGAVEELQHRLTSVADLVLLGRARLTFMDQPRPVQSADVIRGRLVIAPHTPGDLSHRQARLLRNQPHDSDPFMVRETTHDLFELPIRFHDCPLRHFVRSLRTPSLPKYTSQPLVSR